MGRFSGDLAQPRVKSFFPFSIFYSQILNYSLSSSIKFNNAHSKLQHEMQV
jgi:hypothetical protein